jgi:type VI protein secretion system component VasF
VGTLRNSYHPERHYMRGPGPKWHEKHKAALHHAASAQPKDAQPKLDAPAWRAAARHVKARHDLRYALWILPLTVAALLGFVVVAALAGS